MQWAPDPGPLLMGEQLWDALPSTLSALVLGPRETLTATLSCVTGVTDRLMVSQGH